MGGLGVLGLRIFNYAMLLKWFWWWYKPENKIWKPIITTTVNTIELVPDTAVFNQIPEEIRVFFNIST